METLGTQEEAIQLYYCLPRVEPIDRIFQIRRNASVQEERAWAYSSREKQEEPSM